MATASPARFSVMLVLAALAYAIASAFLPFSPRIAWQAAAGTDMFHARWIWERLHDDPAPIDVAVLGSSRLEAGISPQVLSARLSARIGRPVRVANLAIVMPGRDFAFETVKQLYATHPEVRLIVLSDDGFVVNSHPLFREVADPGDLIAAPVVVNTKYFANLAYLPYRNLLNVAKQAFPLSFGVAPTFDRSAYLGTDLDRTRGYRVASGKWVNGDQARPVPELIALAAQGIAAQRAGKRRFSHVPPEMSEAIDRAYVARIAALARAHGTRIAFLKLPFFGPLQPIGDPDPYRAIGPDFSLPALADQPALFQNGAHLNRAGAVRASQMAGDMLAPLVAQALPARGPTPAKGHP